MAAASTNIDISEIYVTIQGESTYAGKRCVFVRLAGCDVRCVWCDSTFAWDGGDSVPIELIVEKILEFGCGLVEVTGGEPLMQQGASELMSRLIDSGLEVLLETSGTRDIDGAPEGVHRIVDVKCPSAKAQKPFLKDNIGKLRHGDEIKLVIADRDDYVWAREFMRLFEPPVPVESIFSPVWGRLDPAELAGWILEDGLDVRLQVQLHRVLWAGQQRGR